MYLLTRNEYAAIRQRIGRCPVHPFVLAVTSGVGHLCRVLLKRVQRSLERKHLDARLLIRKQKRIVAAATTMTMTSSSSSTAA